MTSLTQEIDSLSTAVGASGSSSQVWFEIGGERVSIPISSGPGVQGTGSTILAIAAGEMHGKLFRDLKARFEVAGRDTIRLRKLQVRHLASLKSIRSDEVLTLDEIVDITSKAGKGIDVERLRVIFERLVDTDASPMAVAVASIAVNSGGAQASSGGGVAGADVGGAIGGGVLAGLGGAALGAAFASFGAAVGSMA